MSQFHKLSHCYAHAFVAVRSHISDIGIHLHIVVKKGCRNRSTVHLVHPLVHECHTHDKGSRVAVTEHICVVAFFGLDAGVDGYYFHVPFISVGHLLKAQYQVVAEVFFLKILHVLD